MKNNYLLIILAFIFAVSVLGCNTLKGAGKDVEDAGKSIQKIADMNN